MPDIQMEIVKEIGVISESKGGWTKEINLIKWNNNKPKYDIRDWGPNREKIGKGITFNKDELIKLRDILNSISFDE